MHQGDGRGGSPLPAVQDVAVVADSLELTGSRWPAAVTALPTPLARTATVLRPA
ncbi:hypothetical protein [Streptomyces sp. NPDC060077]|uniref:hypothetical protein n=1 Tax=Streptomyces sp. NPDC060077 TaxID=3347052 RepID=UPI0036557B79